MQKDPHVTLARPRVMPESFFRKYVPDNDFRTALVCNFPNLEITNLARDDESREASPFTKCCMMLLSGNLLDENGIEQIWVDFPSIWWVYLSMNKVAQLERVFFPMALGVLDLSLNPLHIEDFHNLASCHILRLYLSNNSIGRNNIALDADWDVQLAVTKNLPFVWVLNDLFIPYTNRRFFASNHGKPAFSDETKDSGWTSLQVNDRQGSILQAMHHLERTDAVSDIVRLDILLEDYMQESLIWYNYSTKLDRANNCGIKVPTKRRKGYLSNLNSILFVPHRARLDLSVLLTNAVMFDIPHALLLDSATILLGQHVSTADIEALVTLPSFALSAVVSLLRRISKQEVIDTDEGHESRLLTLRINPATTLKYQSDFIASYDGHHGFQFLRDAQRYIHFRFSTTGGSTSSQRNVHDPHYVAPYTELEREILAYLPDTPTKWCGYGDKIPTNEKEATKMRQKWLSFSARHSVFLLNKAPSCPPLNGICRSTKEQDYYLRLLPLLQAANMTLVDLDIVTRGPQADGRALSDAMKAANLHSNSIKGKTTEETTNTDCDMSEQRKRLIQGLDILQGKVLPFGMGLPRASVQSLRWQISDDLVRNYDKPWQANTRFATTTTTDEKTSEDTNAINAHQSSHQESPEQDGAFFVTSDADVHATHFEVGHQHATSRKHLLSNSLTAPVVHPIGYLVNYDNPLANRSSPLVMAPAGDAKQEVYRLDLSFDDSILDRSQYLYEEHSTGSNVDPHSTIIRGAGGGEEKAKSSNAFSVQQVELDYERPSSRAISPSTWTAHRGSQSSPGKHHGNHTAFTDRPATSGHSSRPTTSSGRQIISSNRLSPSPPTLEHPEYQPQPSPPNGSPGGRQFSAMYNLDQPADSLLPELLPPEFHPHSRVPSFMLPVKSNSQPTIRELSISQMSFNSQVNTVLAHLTPTNPSTPMAGNAGNPTAKKETNPDLADDLDSITGKESVGARSFVSISLPSVDGGRRGLSTLQRNDTALTFADTLPSQRSADGEEENRQEVALPQPQVLQQSAVQPTSMHQLHHLQQLQQQEVGNSRSASPVDEQNQQAQLLNQPQQHVELYEQFDHPSQQQFRPSHDHFVGQAKKVMHTIGAYSADKLWQPQFLLAPNQAVDNFNHHYQLYQQQQMHHKGDLYWQGIQQAPIVVTEMDAPLLEPGTLQVRPSITPRTVFLHSLSFQPHPLVQHGRSRSKSPPTAIRHHEMDRFDSEHGVADLHPPAITYDDDLHSVDEEHRSIAFSEMTPSVSASYSDQNPPISTFSAPQAPQHQQEHQQERSRREHEASAFRSNKQSRSATSKKRLSGGRLPSASPKDVVLSAHEVKSAATELLKGMGTLRNARDLDAFNSYLRSLKLNAAGHVVVAGESKSRTSGQRRHESTTAGGDDDDLMGPTSPLSQTQRDANNTDEIHRSSSSDPVDMTLINQVLLTQRPSMALFLQSSQQQRTSTLKPDHDERLLTTSGKEDEPFFFTEAPAQTIEHHADNEAEATEVGKEEKSEDDFLAGTLAFNAVTRDLHHLQVPTSPLHQHISQLHEEHPNTRIFSDETYVDQSQTRVTITGAKVSSAFYPVYPKVVYRMREPTVAPLPQPTPVQSSKVDTDGKPRAQSTSVPTRKAKSLTPGTALSVSQKHAANRVLATKMLLLDNAVLTPADSLVSTSRLSSVANEEDRSYQDPENTDGILQDGVTKVAEEQLQFLLQHEAVREVVQATKNNIALLQSSSRQFAQKPRSQQREVAREVATTLLRQQHQQHQRMQEQAYYQQLQAEQQDFNAYSHSYLDDNASLPSYTQPSYSSHSSSSQAGFYNNHAPPRSGPFLSTSSAGTNVEPSRNQSLTMNSTTELVGDLRLPLLRGVVSSPPPPISTIENDLAGSGRHGLMSMSLITTEMTEGGGEQDMTGDEFVSLSKSLNVVGTGTGRYRTYSNGSMDDDLSASSASSGVNEHGSHRIYQAYSSQLLPGSHDKSLKSHYIYRHHHSHYGSKGSHSLRQPAVQNGQQQEMVPQAQQWLPSSSLESSLEGDHLHRPYEGTTQQQQAPTDQQPQPQHSGSGDHGALHTPELSVSLHNLSLSQNQSQQGALSTELLLLSPEQQQQRQLGIHGQSNNMKGPGFIPQRAHMLLLPSTTPIRSLSPVQQQQRLSTHDLEGSSRVARSTERKHLSNSVSQPQLAVNVPQASPLSNALPGLSNAARRGVVNNNDLLVKPHRRLRAISSVNPITKQVWVGRQHYKAATAKVTVDPAFRLPYLHQQPTQQQQTQLSKSASAGVLLLRSPRNSPKQGLEPVAITAEMIQEMAAASSGEGGREHVVMTMSQMLPHQR